MQPLILSPFDRAKNRVKNASMEDKVRVLFVYTLVVLGTPVFYVGWRRQRSSALSPKRICLELYFRLSCCLFGLLYNNVDLFVELYMFGIISSVPSFDG